MSKKYKYNAFISYRHISPDKEIADKLQKMLESYKMPKSSEIKKAPGKWRVFRDETELQTSSDLSGNIRNALEESEFLIVVCSEATADSKWCMEEIEHFKKIHNGSNENIITVVADGEPEKVFPAALCNELRPEVDGQGNVSYVNHVVEPLAANVAAESLNKSYKKLKSEFLRIAAPLAGCDYDKLYNRTQKRKTRRMIIAGTVAMIIMLLFSLYNGAMLWQINNQKMALAAANLDLQNKTRELDLTNKNLIQTNEDLEKQTAEAEKQRKIAEDNLSEANHQRKLAEDNLSEANRQRKLAEDNLAEANRQKKLAEDNLAEANRQKKLAEDNLSEANRQKEIAEENMRIALENEAKANEANRNLRITNTEILANQAKIYLDNNNVDAAIETAIQAMPQEGEDIPVNAVAEKVLADATGIYKHEQSVKAYETELSGYVKYMEYSDDGNSIFASDTKGNIYVINARDGKLLKTVNLINTFGQASDYYDDIYTDGKNGYVLCDDQVLSVNLSDGNTNWHFKQETTTEYNGLSTNPKSENIYLFGYNTYMILNKDGAVVQPKKKWEFKVGNTGSFGFNAHYTDSEGQGYIVDTHSASIYITDGVNESVVEGALPEKTKILAVGETAEGFLINCEIRAEEGYEAIGARVICIDKKTRLLKWKTDYSGEGVSEYYCNEIFGFTHAMPDENEVYYAQNGVVAVSGNSIAAFDMETGKQYYYYMTPETLIYCKAKEKGSIVFATSEKLYIECYLMPKTSNESDGIGIIGSATFDEPVEMYAYSNEVNFATTGEKSSVITIAAKVEYDNYQLLPGLVSDGTFKEAKDNGSGIIAARYYDYIDNDRIERIILYNVNSKTLLAELETSSSNVLEMHFAGDKLFVSGSEIAEVWDLNGKLIDRINLQEMFKNLIDGSYVSTSEIYATVDDTTVLYCVNGGIFAMDLSGEKIAVRKIYNDTGIGKFHIDGKMISFVSYGETYTVRKIAYFKDGDTEPSYVKENGTEKVFVRDSVTEVVNSPKGDFIAFVNKEGYIGVYRCGDDNFSKIELDEGENSPVKTTLSSDAGYIYTLCANGWVIKYSVDTLEKVASYKVNFEVSDSSIMEFIEGNVMCIRKYSSTYADTVLLNTDTMQPTAEIEDYLHFMKNDKIILFADYFDGTIGYYQYKTGQKLVDYAKEFVGRQ